MSCETVRKNEDEKVLKKNKAKWIVDQIIDIISGIFLPLVNVMSAVGILKGLVAISVTTGLLSESSGTYQILYSMADSFFYFLPVFLAYTSSKKLGTSSYTAVLVAGVLLHPNLTKLFQSGSVVNFLGLKVTSVTYSSSVIPIIMAVALLYYVENFFYKVIPEVVREFFAPLCSLLVVAPVTLLIFGPIGILIGNVLASWYSVAYNFSPVMAGVCLGFLIQIMVIFGFHWSLVPLAINNIVVYGSDTILALMGPAAFAQAGAAFAVCLRTKSKKLKTVSLSAGISAVFGVTEPALFGVNLPLKKPLFFVCIGGAVGGGIVGAAGTSAMSFAFPGLATLPVFLGKGFTGFITACAIGLLVSFFLTFFIKFKDRIMENETSK